MLFSVACSSFLYDESDIVIYADDEHLTSDADTLWSVAGIMNKMQAIADRTILLGELRGDLVTLTDNADGDLRAIADFTYTTASSGSTPNSSLLTPNSNKYDVPADYYAIINNCNYFIAHADTALRNNRNEFIFMKEYAAVKAFRAWTYLQLALNYGRVPFITDPITSKEQSEREFPMYGIDDVCRYFITDLAPYVETELPGYGHIRNTESRLFYFPVYVLLGDLNLWAGNYRAAAENYYKYISTRNGRNSSYPISTNAVRFSRADSHWRMTQDSWSTNAFSITAEAANANAELITMIPGDSIPSEGNYSYLRNLFNSNADNEYRESIVPSQALFDLSAAQSYCHYTSGGDYVFSPSGLEDNRSGDLRLQAVYSKSELNLTLNGRHIDNYVSNQKYSSRNVHLYRRAMVYLRMAEALNRAGFPRFAFQILKSGVNNRVIAEQVLPYYPADSAFIASFDFPNILYVLETNAGGQGENTIGLHSRGSGYTAANDTYAFLEDSVLLEQNPAYTATQILNAQITYVEDLITDEEALEFAFEGHRFYDLMRVALRRNDPSYLANRVARRTGVLDPTLQTILSDQTNWYMKLE